MLKMKIVGKQILYSKLSTICRTSMPGVTFRNIPILAEVLVPLYVGKNT